MWHLDEELKDWFEEVTIRHEQDRGVDPGDKDETVPLWENELAQGRGRRSR